MLPIQSQSFRKTRKTHDYALPVWTVDLPGVYFTEIVEKVFKRNEIATGSFAALQRDLEKRAIFAFAARHFAFSIVVCSRSSRLTQRHRPARRAQLQRYFYRGRVSLHAGLDGRVCAGGGIGRRGRASGTSADPLGRAAARGPAGASAARARQ